MRSLHTTKDLLNCSDDVLESIFDVVDDIKFRRLGDTAEQVTALLRYTYGKSSTHLRTCQKAIILRKRFSCTIPRHRTAAVSTLTHYVRTLVQYPSYRRIISLLIPIQHARCLQVHVALQSSNIIVGVFFSSYQQQKQNLMHSL